jgi:hypothetical protein
MIQIKFLLEKIESNKKITSFSCLHSLRILCINCSLSISIFFISFCASLYCCLPTVISASSKVFLADNALNDNFRSSNASCNFFNFSANDLEIEKKK